MNDPAPSATPAVPPRAISRAAPDPVARSLAALALVTTLVAAWVAVEARQGVHEIESSAGGMAGLTDDGDGAFSRTC